MGIFEQFEKTVRRYPRKKAISFFDNGKLQSWSYQEFRDKVVALSIGLLHLGLKKGDRIAILAPNSPAWSLIDLAAARAGLVLVPIHTTLSGDQIRHIIQQARAKALVLGSHIGLASFYTLRELLPGLTDSTLALLKDHLPSVRNIILLNHDEEPIQARKHTHHISDLMEIGKKQLRQARAHLRPVVRSSDISTIIYTSGTTGTMKGVILTHRNLVENAIGAGMLIDSSSKDVHLLILPLSHAFERTAGLLLPLFYGYEVVFGRGRDYIAEDIQLSRPTILGVVPRILEKIYAGIHDKIQKKSRIGAKLFELGLKADQLHRQWKSEQNHWAALVGIQSYVADRLFFSKIRTQFGGRLTRFVSGGAPLDPKIADFFTNIGIPVLEGYGLTEAAPIVTVNPCVKPKIGSVGLPLPKVKLKIASNGEILVKGPNVMCGYEKNLKETRRALGKDGWLYTGDQGRLDKDGYLHVTGRIKEMIITSYGKNIVPSNVEKALEQSPLNKQVMVYGEGQAYLVAFVVPDLHVLEQHANRLGLSGHGLQSLCRHKKIQQLIAHEIERCSRSLAQHERIKKFCLIPEEFTEHNSCLTPTLKLRRRVIIEKYRKEVDGLYNGRGTSVAA